MRPPPPFASGGADGSVVPGRSAPDRNHVSSARRPISAILRIQRHSSGGSAGITYDPNYHTPDDTIDNVDTTALEIMSKAIAHATITWAYDTSAINGVRTPGKSGCAGKSCDAPGLAPGEAACLRSPDRTA